MLVNQEELAEPTEHEARMKEFMTLLELIRSAIQADGGDLTLVDVDTEGGVVEVMLEGACSSCAISSATLGDGVERILRDRLPWIKEVRGGIDEDFDLSLSQARGRGSYVAR